MPAFQFLNCCSPRQESNFRILVPSSDWCLLLKQFTSQLWKSIVESISCFICIIPVLFVFLKIILFILFQPWVSWSKPCREWEKLQQPQLWERTESWVSGTTICCEFIQFFLIMNSNHSMSYCMNLVLSSINQIYVGYNYKHFTQFNLSNLFLFSNLFKFFVLLI